MGKACIKGVPFRQAWLLECHTPEGGSVLGAHSNRGVCQGLTFNWFIELAAGRGAAAWLPASRRAARQLSGQRLSDIEYAVDMQTHLAGGIERRAELLSNRKIVSCDTQVEHGVPPGNLRTAMVEAIRSVGPVAMPNRLKVCTLDMTNFQHRENVPTKSHCTGVAWIREGHNIAGVEPNARVLFFDANFGEYQFRKIDDLAWWIKGSRYLDMKKMCKGTVSYEILGVGTLVTRPYRCA